MYDLIFWLYVGNSVLLITHEMDSAYWKEWNLFWPLVRPKAQPLSERSGLTFFLLIHLPVLAAVLYGLVEVFRGTTTGLVFSLCLAGAGLFAFFIHRYFIKKGNDEFTWPVSRLILRAILLISTLQLAATLVFWS